MTIPGRGSILVFSLVALSAMVIFAGYGWMQEHDARIKTESETSQQQKQIEGLKQQQVDVQQALAVKLSSLEQERRQPATAAQLIRSAVSLSPDLPEELRVEAIPQNPELPDGPATQSVVIPEADFKSVRDAELSCQADSAKLAACQTTQQDGEQQLKLTEAQRDEWRTAAKGGSIWHRALGAAKWFAVGVGSGVVVYAVTHHK